MIHLHIKIGSGEQANFETNPIMLCIFITTDRPSLNCYFPIAPIYSDLNNYTWLCHVNIVDEEYMDASIKYGRGMSAEIVWCYILVSPATMTCYVLYDYTLLTL